MTSRGWDIEIESAEGLAATADALERFAVHLESDPRALGSCASLNTALGVISASFGVLATDEIEASTVARAAFIGALASTELELPERAIARLSVSLERGEALTPAS
jgi:hypothetical protein